MDSFTTAPLTSERWDDLVDVFGGGDGKGDCGRCWCMWWRLPRQSGLGMGERSQLKSDFRAIVDAGPPPGLIGYAEGVPVVWVQVGPRSAVPEWSKPGRLTSPTEPSDAEGNTVWGISCFVVRAGHRKKGYMTAMLNAAVDYARNAGALCLDACPVDAAGKATSSALFHGVAAPFRNAGFEEIARRKANRPLMRLAL